MKWVAPIKNKDEQMEFAQRLKAVGDKYYIMFRIGIGTGMLLQDILYIKCRDIAGKDKFTTKIGVKEVETSMTFDDELKEVIAAYTADRDPDSYFLTSSSRPYSPISREQAYRVMKDVARDMGLADIGAQTMRKTFAYNYYKDTGDVTYLQEILNHSSATVTYRYIGERPAFETPLKKRSIEENERSRYLLLLNGSGKERLKKVTDELNEILENFDNPSNNDSFYGTADSLITELETLMETYENSK